MAVLENLVYFGKTHIFKYGYSHKKNSEYTVVLIFVSTHGVHFKPIGSLYKYGY